MKKSISVVALDSRAGESYTGEIRGLFGEYAHVTAYSVRDGSAMGNLPRADLFVISTDAYGSAEEVARHIPIDCQSMGIEVSYRWSTLEALGQLPKGTKALFVNMTDTMAREAIAQLEQLGVNHIRFIPFFPGAVLKEAVDIAVTPDEERYVPPSVARILNIGHRSCTSGMMIEIALRLGLEQLLETEKFQEYFRSMATNNYSFDQMYSRSQRLESQFHILMEILEEGLVGVNEKGEIFACNKRACEIARISEHLALGKMGEHVFPYIPFYSALKDKKAVPARMTKLNGVNVTVAVMPVLRQQECIGAFATLQKFNDLESRQHELRAQLLNKGHRAKYTFEDVIGACGGIRQTKEILKRMAVTESPILIIGETGTGKELLAHAVHRASKREKGPFIAINVAAMPENLLESELFGYEEGAFTGAKKGGRPGLFEFAHRGTLFLDEVEGMSAAMQVKLLRVLQEGEVMRVGGNRIISIDVRIVAATNESLEQKVEDGSFRRDLYYRLNTLPVVVPPLRERGDDIFLLLDRFREELGGRFTLSPEVRAFLRSYFWPGNIRELHNAAEYFNYTGKQIIEMEDLPPTISTGKHYVSGMTERKMRKAGGDAGTGDGTDTEDTGARGGTDTEDTGARGGTGTGDAGAGGAGTADTGARDGTGTGDAGADRAAFAGTVDSDAGAGVPVRPAVSPSWFLLQQLFLASEQGASIGREKLLLLAKKNFIPLSQKEIRDRLKYLEAEGCATVGRGRGGSRITAKGREVIAAGPPGPFPS